MHIHILGICGTFMGGIAVLARQMGHEVTGSDANVYPPMSTQLEEEGIKLYEGYDVAQLDPAPDMVVIGNALSRGNAAVEFVLDRGLPYISGPQFLADFILKDRWVLAVAGTHGKTTTSSMLAWILEYAKLKPGFLVGGIPANFDISARLGDAPFFVVEADEYDTAFFDKRSKFVHYRPRTLVLNNLEFDHADIFDDLDAIKRQFHHLVRTVPGNGLIIAPVDDPNLVDVISQGCWTPVEYFDTAGVEDPETQLWNVRDLADDGSAFAVYWGDEHVGDVQWPLFGMHNVHNALAAIAAARHAGVIASQAVAALNEFKNVKRRMEVRGVVNGVTVYDDFAHHPTAINLTLDGLRKRVGSAKIIAVLEPRSNTMKMGVHEQTLGPALEAADEVVLYQPADLGWNLDEIANSLRNANVFDDVANIVNFIVGYVREGDHVLIMSNGGFGGIHALLLEALRKV
jgi:UDP-N-acetylmuramate: L-alanyl-gamma-D-glutamyl-meso-diaminopimelate ligase